MLYSPTATHPFEGIATEMKKKKKKESAAMSITGLETKAVKGETSLERKLRQFIPARRTGPGYG